jgi:hypothetical protein
VPSYLQAIAEEIRANATGEAANPDAEPDPVYLIYAVLARALGPNVTASHVHDAWVAACEIEGREGPLHIKFEDLDADTRALDEPFAQAIREVGAQSG